MMVDMRDCTELVLHMLRCCMAGVAAFLLNWLDMEQCLELLDCSSVEDLPGVELLAQ